jgi:hypothetical protein
MDPIKVYAVEPGRAPTVYRIVLGGDRKSQLVLESLRSNYERGRAPRKLERVATVVRMGLSAFTDEGDAHAVARHFTKLGGFVAELILTPGEGFNYAVTGRERHLTVWGDPIKLRRGVTAIRAVLD